MSPDSVVICTSDFFSGSETPTFFTAESQPNPGAGALSLRALEDDHFLAWEADSDSGPLYLFTPNDNLYSQLGTHERPIVDLECAADSYLLLDSSGTIELRKYGAESPDFTFSYSGLRDICFAGSMLMAAGNSASLLSSPLLQINPRTGETVPIPDSNILTFRLRSKNSDMGIIRRLGN